MQRKTRELIVPENHRLADLLFLSFLLFFFPRSVHIHRLLFVEPATFGGKTHDLVPGPEVFDGARGVRSFVELRRRRDGGRSFRGSSVPSRLEIQLFLTRFSPPSTFQVPTLHR